MAQIFRLEPIADGMHDRSWEATELHERCWVRAVSEEYARIAVAAATLKMTDVKPGLPMVHSPWRNDRLTRCTVDDSGKEIKAGTLVTDSGKIFSVF